MNIPELPKWSIPSFNPAFFDTESATAIEMVAKLYSVCDTLIKECNEFSNYVDKELKKYTDGTNEDIEAFKVGLRQEFQDFIDVVNLKIKHFNNEVDEAVLFMTENIEDTVNQYITEHGVKLELAYDEENEALDFVMSEMFDGGLTQEDIDELAGKLEV